MDARRISPLAYIPPPLLFVAAFLIGLAMGKLLGLAPEHGAGASAAGWALLVAGILIGPGSALSFALRRTTLIPHGTPSKLVTGGVYRLTRNPMYLGLAIGYAGVALVLGRPVPLVLLPLPLLLIDRLVIPMEEARLRTVFGADYARYAAQVRRWL